MKKNILTLSLVTGAFFISSCSIGPDYNVPKLILAAGFKETPKGWKVANPRDQQDKGQWWRIFKDSQLNALIAKVNISNQNIASAVAQYQQALALVDQTNANYWPTISVASSARRGQASPQGGTNNAVSHNANFSWSPDVFGVVARAKEASIAGAKASAAQLADTKLAMQALLAQTYFQLRALDVTQALFDQAVVDYQALLTLTNNQYQAGIAARLNVLESEAQLQTASASALDNRILRGQYEHAIAVLVGEVPANFALKFKVVSLTMPNIPLQAPSALLERLPAIAHAERLMAQANAQIGLAKAAYFPLITLTGSEGFASNTFTKLLMKKNNVWSLGSTLAATLVDGGARDAKLASALAAYDQSVAVYKQTVLSAMQKVEDNLIALRILEDEVKVQALAVANLDTVLQITMNQYKSGTTDYANVIKSLTNFYSAKQIAAMLYSRRMVAAVALIQALGGGWDAKNNL